MEKDWVKTLLTFSLFSHSCDIGGARSLTLKLRARWARQPFSRTCFALQETLCALLIYNQAGYLFSPLYICLSLCAFLYFNVIDTVLKQRKRA
jgi:hypothetical protein